jgi:hypothetical protein
MVTTGHSSHEALVAISPILRGLQMVGLPLLGDTERPVMSGRDGGSLARFAGFEDVPGALGDPAAIGRCGPRPAG